MNDADFSLAELATTASPVAELSSEHQPSRVKDRKELASQNSTFHGACTQQIEGGSYHERSR